MNSIPRRLQPPPNRGGVIHIKLSITDYLLMALLVVKYSTSMLRQIQNICNLSFVFFDIFLTRGIFFFLKAQTEN